MAAGGDTLVGGWCCESSQCATAKCCCSPDCSKDAAGKWIMDSTGICGNASCNNIVCPFSVHKSLYSLITTISNYIFYIGLILAPLMIVIGGFLFMAAGGSPERAQLGKKIITWALIGLGFILFAKGVASIIGGVLFG